MYKPRILIVDDDTMVRIGLKTVINWDENGFVLVGEAQDGKQALEQAEVLQPDIIITDIKMPGMNGIELIRQLKEKGSAAEILVLSSYDEFDLVKESLKLGAKDYLLKLNLNPEELILCLRQIAADKGTLSGPTFSASDEKKRSLLRQNFLWDVVSNFYLNEESLETTMRELDIKLASRPIYCMILKAGELYRFEELSAEETHTLKFSVINITEEIINDSFCGYCFSGKTGEFNVLLSGIAHQDDASVEKMAQRLRRMLMEYLNLSCTISIGCSSMAGSEGIKDAFWQANAALAHRFYLEHDGVLFWHSNMKKLRQDSYSMSGLRAELSDTLMVGRSEDLKRIFDRLIEDMHRLELSKSTVCSVALELFYIVQEYFEKNDLSAEQILKKSFRTYEQLLHMESLREVTAWMQKLLEDLLAMLQKESEKGHQKLIGVVLDWIAAHYKETAALQEVAQVVNLNPSYLSTLLRKHTGRSYTELLTEYRMEKAKELLLYTNEKVYRVGQLVGYEDKYYFGRVFKRVTGMSPGEFKSQKRGLHDDT